MGTVVYGSLLTLLLDEKDYSLEEIKKIAIERYGFSKENSKLEMGFQITIGKLDNRIIELPNGKLRKIGDFCSNLYLMLGGPDTLPENHHDRINPKRRQFYIDLEDRYGKTHRQKESIKKSVDNNLDDDIPF